MFECAPVMVVHAVSLRNTASSICPRRKFFQFHCSEDTQCMEDAQKFVDIADTHEFYTCGVLARHLYVLCFFKSGRRRALLCANHGNVCLDDIDFTRMSEFKLGKSSKLTLLDSFRPQNIFLNFSIFSGQ